MNIHFIEQTDQEGNLYKWVAIDEETASYLYENEYPLYYVREDAEGLIEDIEDLESAIENSSVCPEDSYLWEEEFKEGEQNRFRDNNDISFQEWLEQKIDNLI